MNESLADFGYQKVPESEKTQRVQDVFSSVASRYDVMNDLMSFGLHRFWKRFLIQHTGARRGQCFLDLASGTGDVARLLASRVGETGCVVASDLNAEMLQEGRKKSWNAGWVSPLHYVRATAESLPFPSGTFDGVTIAFGLRNVTHQEEALREMYRVLKPGARLCVLEFSHPSSECLKALYDAYSFHVIPRMGEYVTQDRASYQYLVESIRKHPSAALLKQRIVAAGFDDCRVHRLVGGIVALHQAFKY